MFMMVSPVFVVSVVRVLGSAPRNLRQIPSTDTSPPNTDSAICFALLSIGNKGNNACAVRFRSTVDTPEQSKGAQAQGPRHS